jgi:hypothetical protein
MVDKRVDGSRFTIVVPKWIVVTVAIVAGLGIGALGVLWGIGRIGQVWSGKSAAPEAVVGRYLPVKLAGYKVDKKNEFASSLRQTFAGKDVSAAATAALGVEATKPLPAAAILVVNANQSTVKETFDTLQTGLVGVPAGDLGREGRSGSAGAIEAGSNSRTLEVNGVKAQLTNIPSVGKNAVIATFVPETNVGVMIVVFEDNHGNLPSRIIRDMIKASGR